MSDILRYRGDIVETIDRTQMLGPDFGGRYLRIRSATHDPATDLTTVKLAGVLPAEFRERVEPLVAMQQERERIRAPFNG